MYHVTKEFGPASLTNVGLTVTSLAAAQQRTGLVDTRIVMPYYSFLKNKYDIDKHADLVLDVRDKKGKLTPIEFRVWKMTYVFDPPPKQANITVWQVVDGVNTSVSVAPPPAEPKPVPATEKVSVYLIGPGNRRPFSQAFRARNALQIYTSAPVGLPTEWRDQFFTKAAAAFLTHQATAIDEESLFAPIRLAPHIDVIHMHGAATAYVAKSLRERRDAHQLGPKPPALVYTMHDYMDELQYTHSVHNVRKFSDDVVLDVNARHIRGNRLFMSSLGIDQSDVVSVVGRTMASDMIEGRSEFYLKELMMESVLQKAQYHRFFGISNGLGFDGLNPFTHEKLVTRKLGFPEYARDLVQQQPALSTLGSDPASLLASTKRSVWPLSALPNDYVSTAKDRAKRFLVRRSLLQDTDLKRPLVLYVGQFQYDKGLELFDQAAELFAKHNMKFIIMGQPGDYPQERVEALQARYPDDVVVMSTPKQQRQWSVFCRSAADFVFVPSQTDTMGLAAAEGLLFGASVISSGAGGMGEYLVDRPEAAWTDAEPTRDIHIIRDKQTKVPTVTSSEYYNAYLFQPTTLEAAVQDAAADYQRINRSKVLREEYVLRMIRASFSLGWERGAFHGPVHEYRRLYEIAMADRQLPQLRSHEVDEEETLLRRLLLERQQQALGLHQPEYDA